MVAIPQVITEDRASGAQFIDGSLKFDKISNQYLKRTPSSAGNRKTWTISFWAKRTVMDNQFHTFMSVGTVDGNEDTVSFDGNQLRIRYDTGSDFETAQLLRDTGWYHIVIAVDTTLSTSTDRIKYYINGTRVTNLSPSTQPGQNFDFRINNNQEHAIGKFLRYSPGDYAGYMSQYYFLDGISAGPEEFGFTDALTGTWRPKKYSGTFPSGNAASSIFTSNTLLTWSSGESNWALSDSNKTATYSGNGNYSDVWSGALNGSTTYAFRLTNTGVDGNGGWLFTDSTGVSGTHPDERGSNTLGQRANETTLGAHGSFATANSVSSGQGAMSGFGDSQPSAGSQIDFVVNMSARKVWVKAASSGSWVGGGDPTNSSSTASFELPSGTIYFGSTQYSSSTVKFGDDSTGNNSFYLPMDGKSPIGKDQSGNGNDWEPVAFGGSVELPKATGAIPILNTNEAGTVAKPGVRTDKKTYTVTASGGNYYLDGALKPTLNAYRGGSYTFDYTGATSHPLYLSSLPDGRHDSSSYSVALDGNGDYLSIPANADFELTGEFTLEYFLYLNSSSSETPVVSWGNGSYKTIFTGSGDTWKLEYPSTTLSLGGTASANVGNWKHYALSRDSNNVLRWFIDGKLISTNTVNATIGANEIFTPGFKSNSSNYLHGYISNLRLVKGQALYTSSFTPPSSTLTTTSQGATASNVKLLCCRAEQATTATVSPGTITAAGDAQTTQVHQPFLYSANGVNGVNTGTSNTTKITIPHTAADTLYYYCHNHSGMGSSINVTTDIFKADPYAWKCMFAMASDTVDHSPEINVNSTATSFGDIHTSTPQGLRNLYGHSKKMETGGGFRIDMELTTAEANAKHKFDKNDFTLECWFYQDGGQTSWQSLFRSASYNNSGLSSDGIALYGNGQTLWPYSVVSGSGQNWGQTGNVVPYKKWNHAAWTRQGDVNRIFANGILVKTFNNSHSWDNKGWEIGDVYTWNGGYQDARIYNGVAKYTESFVVPATEPDILPDTPSGITGKTNLTKITDGAVTGFESSSDHLTLAASSDFEFTGDHTIEMFVYHNTLAGDSVPYATGGSGSPDQIYINTIGELYYGYGQTGAINSPSGTIVSGKWQHIAVSKQGTYLRAFVDGKMVAASTDHSSTIGSSSAAPYIGMRGDNNHFVEGFISNLRIVKGTALYTSDFTPPTEPLTEVTNTKLLCCQSPTSAGAAAVSPNISGINDGTVWSSYFTGNHDSTHGWGTLYHSSNAFDGNLNSMAIGQVDSEGLTWTAPGGGIGADATTIRIYGNDDNCPDDYLKINGINYGGLITQGFGPDWTVLKGTGAVGAGITQLESVYLRDNSAGNQHYRWRALEIDGTVIVDPVIAKGDAVATNFNPFTDDINAIRGRETGYCTMNPLDQKFTDNGTISNGNLDYAQASTGARGARCTIGASSGKFYWEFTHLGGNASHGIQKISSDLGSYPGGNDADGISWFVGGNIYRNGSTSAYASKTYAVGDCIGTALDLDNGTLVFYKNGVSQGVAASGLTGTWFPSFGSSNVSVVSFTSNFGQKPFKFPPPDGFQPLNLSNVQPEKVFARPDQYIGVTLYTGSGETISPRTIELPHAADLVWAKSRDRASSHQIADTVRGNNSVLNSNTNFTARNPTTSYNGGGVSIIDGKTISLVKGSTNQANNENLNATGQKGLVWSWKAGGSSNTFNIDDVGYANASDVNMNVGALNSAQFLKGQVWSGLMSVASGSFDQAASRAFDGFLRTDPNRLRTSGNQVLVTMTLSTPVTVSSQIKVYAEPGYNSSCTVTVGGVTHTSSTGALHTFNVSGSLTQMTLQSTQSGGRTYMEGMEIDGKLLVDDNITVNSPSVDNTGCSVGTKQGFSIVAYNATGSNLRVSHGLSERPGLIILKTVHSTSGDWLVWHQSLNGVDRFLKLNDGQAQAQADNVFLSVDSNTFGTGDDAGINSNNQQKISYIWHDVPGLQKFGKYVGNASADGTFIELGFKPAIVWTKRIDAGSNWLIHDSSRDPSNPVYGTLWGNLSNTEGRSNVCIDMTSTGFKHRNADGGTANNHSGASYIYCAWAEAPTVNLYGGHANAR